MILLADGGSTKVHWCLIDKGNTVKELYTKGANPFSRSSESIKREFKEYLTPEFNKFEINSVHFFGAGCAFPEKNKIIEIAISQSIDTKEIEIGSDLLAAAIGLLGDNKGIACILGTGSNSCFYDGEKIVENVSPLGYVLGDEGSGAVIGRIFIGACLKNQLTKGLKEKFLKEYDLNLQSILDNVYKQPLANRFLAGFSPFILQHLDDPTIYNLVYKSFEDFFRKNVMQYDYKNNKVSFVGSVAYYYKEILRKVGESMGIEIENIEQSPMSGLIKYYSQKSI